MKEIILDESLLTRSDEVNVEEDSKLIKEIVSELKHVIKHTEGMVSLSAPQIGYYKRVFVVKYGEDFRVYINPLIVGASGLYMSKETCHSNPGKRYIIPRHTKIKLAYMSPDESENYTEEDIAGMSAVVIQHQINHIDGVPLDCIGLEIDDNFENATEEEQEEILEMFLVSLKTRQDNLLKEIEKDKELKETQEAIDYVIEKVKGAEGTTGKVIPKKNGKRSKDSNKEK